jgi:[protein-PII] uridylyltransferase
VPAKNRKSIFNAEESSEIAVGEPQLFDLLELAQRAAENDLKWLRDAGKAELKKLRNRSKKRLGRLPGLKLVRRTARDLERIVKAVYLFHRLYHRATNQPVSRHEFALLAVGGFGRGEINLHSDVDLQFLLRGEPSANLEEFMASVFRSLTDIGLDLAALVRTQKDCIRFVGRDFKSITALVTTNYLAGSRKLAQQLNDALSAQLRDGGKGHQWFVDELNEFESARQNDGAETGFVLEPNVKDGPGGLRDHHQLRWYLYTQRSHRTISALHEARIISSADMQRLEDSLNFLLTVRDHLHHLAGRKNDHLGIELQQQIAQQMRFKTRGGQMAHERFMREYHLHAHRLNYIRSHIFRYFAEQGRQSLVGRVTSKILDRREAPYFTVRRGKIYVDDRRLKDWQNDPSGLMRLFLKMVQLDIPLGGRAIERARHEVVKHDPQQFQHDDYNRQAFFKILSGKVRVAECLRMMQDAGVLAYYLPEFKHLHCLVRADGYHKYTVDEHTFRVIENAEQLRSGEAEDANLSVIARRIDRWPIFLLALLLHDVGKGLGPGHALRGGSMTARIAERMKLPEDDANFAHFLVVQHLKFSHLALQRDVSDPKVARELAAVVKTRERLDALYILTYCDMSGVAPGVWNDWTAQLFEELYQRTVQYLERGEVSEEELFSITDEMREQVAAATGQSLDSPELERFLNILPNRYLFYNSPDEIALFFTLAQEFTPDDPVKWKLVSRNQFGRSVLNVVGPDVPGLFRLLTRALSSKGISIKKADCLSVIDGLVLDQFSLLYKEKPLDEDFRLEPIREKCRKVLLGEMTENKAFGEPPPVESPDPKMEEVAPTKVKIDNDASDQYTVCQIQTGDRPGLLSAISRIFNESGLYLHQALIRTEAYRVVDVFYLSTLDNNKLTDRRRVKRLEKKLMEMLNPQQSHNESSPKS